MIARLVVEMVETTARVPADSGGPGGGGGAFVIAFADSTG